MRQLMHMYFEWHVTSEWLKTTIPGIIILGSIGSIAAVIVLKLASVIGRRFSSAAMNRLLLAFRPFSFSALLSYRYASEGRWAQLAIYATTVYTACAVTTVLFGVSLLATIVAAVYLGLRSPGLLFTLVVITGTTFLLAARDLMSMAGLWAVLFQRDTLELKSLLKNRDMLFQLTDQIFNNLKNPPAETSAAGAPSPSTPVLNDPSPAEPGGHIRKEGSSIAHGVSE